MRGLGRRCDSDRGAAGDGGAGSKASEEGLAIETIEAAAIGSGRGARALKAGLAATASASAWLSGRGAARLADDTLAEVKKRGELVIATEMQFPPFDISDNGTYKGVDRD